MPSYDELPVLQTGERHNWDVFGPHDELGCLNFITPERIAAAAAAVRLGEVVNLNLPLGEPQPQFWTAREPLQHKVIRKRNARDDYLDRLAMQGGTQWDGFRHQRYREFGYYGGREEEELDSSDVLGIGLWAERGLVGRGVLADVAGHQEAIGAPLIPTERAAVDHAMLSRTLEAQRTTILPGDILLVRTGWLRWYLELPASEREAYAAEMRNDRKRIAMPGLAPKTDTVAWFWDNSIAAVAVDTPVAEVLPYRPDEGWIHHRLLVLLGLPLGELWYLENLANACRRARRHTFLVTSAPLYVQRAAGTPANAYAIL